MQKHLLQFSASEQYPLFLGGIPNSISEDQLISEITAAFGKIKLIIIPHRRNSKKSIRMGYAFISFVHKASFRAALAQKTIILNGKLVSLKKCQTQENTKNLVKEKKLRTLTICGADSPGLDEVTLIDIFTQFGKVEHASISINPKTLKPTGRGDILMKDPKGYKKALIAQKVAYPPLGIILQINKYVVNIENAKKGEENFETVRRKHSLNLPSSNKKFMIESSLQHYDSPDTGTPIQKEKKKTAKTDKCLLLGDYQQKGSKNKDKKTVVVYDFASRRYKLETTSTYPVYLLCGNMRLNRPLCYNKH